MDQKTARSLGLEHWPPTENVGAPFVDSGFQKKLTDIAGTTLDGRPRVRLVWGQDPQATIFYCGEQRLRYIHHFEESIVGWRASYYNQDGTLREVKVFGPSIEAPAAPGAQIVTPISERRDIGIPRWFLEQYMPPSVACRGWETFDEELGPPPRDGQYEEAFLMIADHSDCCKEELQAGCPGKYCAPDQRHLTYVQFLMWALNSEPYRYTWEEMPPPELIAQDIKERESRIATNRELIKSETNYILQNAMMTHRRRIAGGGGSGLDLNTYHDFGGAFAKAKKF